MLEIVLHSRGFTELLDSDERYRVLQKLMQRAASRNDKDAMNVLLSHGADLIGGYKSSLSPAIVGFAETVETKRFLDSNGACLDRSRHATLLCQPGGCSDDVLFELIRLGADINISTHYNGSPLHCAASTGRTDLVACFIHEGFADVDARDRFGRTPLMVAVEAERASVYADQALIELLLDNGAEVDAQDNSGSTSLHAAILRLDVDAARLLLARGADPNHRGGSRKSLLAQLAGGCDASKVETMTGLLLEYGADPCC